MAPRRSTDVTLNLSEAKGKGLRGGDPSPSEPALSEAEGRLRMTQAIASVTISSGVFIDVAVASPRSRPAAKNRSDISATTASIQSAFQSLSVRYPSDRRKK